MSDPKKPESENPKVESAEVESAEFESAKVDSTASEAESAVVESEPEAAETKLDTETSPMTETPVDTTPTASPQPAPVAAPVVPVKKSKLWIPVFFNFLLTLALIGGLAYGAWWMHPQWQQQQAAVSSVQQHQSQEQESVQATKAAIEEDLQSVRAASSDTLAQAQELSQELKDELRSITERLNAHNQRILSLSNTSREDWMLAEANYLLRLASQRLLVDRQATSALGLMEAVDGILLELAMPDLFSVRQALSRDLGAVRLAAEVDREGIYLRLDGLIHNMEQLPLYQSPLAVPLKTETPVAQATAESPEAAPEATTVMDTALAWSKKQLLAAGDTLSQYFVLQRHDQRENALLAPSQEEYLRQNVRLSLEQAQVAMLREDNAIYAAALNQALDLVQRFFPSSPARQALMDELTMLQSRPIAVDLPQIDNSIEQLEAYIERLHQLAGNSQEPQAE